MTDRFEQKRRQQRRRRWWRIAAGLLVVAAVGFAVWAVWFSSLLDSRSVKVTGIEHLSRVQVVNAADVPMGEPLVRLDTDAITARVAELAPVESVTVSRSWPHGVEIAVKERTAEGWLTRGVTPWAVDRYGVVYRALKSEPGHLPEFDVEADEDDVLSAIGGVAHAIRTGDPDLFADIQVISAESKDSISLDLTGGRTVTWGSADQAELKLRVLDALLPIKATRYDVSAPERPTTQQ